MQSNHNPYESQCATSNSNPFSTVTAGASNPIFAYDTTKACLYNFIRVVSNGFLTCLYSQTATTLEMVNVPSSNLILSLISSFRPGIRITDSQSILILIVYRVPAHHSSGDLQAGSSCTVYFKLASTPRVQICVSSSLWRLSGAPSEPVSIGKVRKVLESASR